MSNTTIVNYGQGAEEAEFFWRETERFTSRFIAFRHRSTAMRMQEVLDKAQMTQLHTESNSTGVHTVVGEFMSGLLMVTWRQVGDDRWEASINSAGESQEASDDAADAFRDLIAEAPDPEPSSDDSIFMDYSYAGSNGARKVTREISAPEWEKISGNYSAAAKGKMDRLINSDPEDLVGKVGIFHGEPRTGKTFFLRSLARAWHDKADFTYIIDADSFFRNPAYMMEILLADTDDWHVLIFEDAEEFITPEAKHDTGQALSRLLNLGDGMLGQGLNVLFLFTTNVTMDKFHPAVTGEGRCFLNLEVPALTVAEAQKWLGDHEDTTYISSPKRIGELYKILRNEEPDATFESVSSGAYL